MQISLEQIAKHTGGHLMHPLSRESAEILVTGVCVDSRLAKPGDIFFCLKGGAVDGHIFAKQAIQAGCVAVVAERDPFDGEVSAKYLLTPVILAAKPIKLLGRLANYWRRQFGGKVIGITGSAGKTTVKEILAQVLALDGPTAKNYLNRNTQVGMPMAMLETTGQEKYWVLEVGINHDHDMDELAPILEPDLALIINVGTVHTEGLGRRGVANHKSTLLKHLRPGGRALVSADYPDLVKEARAAYPGVEFFSSSGKQLNYRGSYLGLGPNERGLYKLYLDGVTLEVSCYLTGPHGAEDLIAVAAVAHSLGVEPGVIAQGIEQAVPPKQRFVRHELPGWSVVDDSYNANPLSYPRVLEAVSELSRDKHLILVLGDMLELAEQSEAEHLHLGEKIQDSGARALFWFGKYGPVVKAGLDQAGYHGHFQILHQAEDFLPALDEYVHSKSNLGQRLILFKGSRGLVMENLVADFLRRYQESGESHAL